jgi:Fe-S-cluster containining protein
MNPACLRCRGACCEYIKIPRRTVGPPDRQWLELHGVVDTHGLITMDVPCRMLLKSGGCAIYKTRPATCVVFEVGCPECREAVRRQRTAAEAEEIERRLG